MQRDQLRGVERFAVPLAEAINKRRWLKGLVHNSVGRVDATWMYWATKPLLQISNFELIERLEAPKGVILVSNHRSFFDMFICCSMLQFNTPWMQRLVFPVRKNFFYDTLGGMLVNALISGYSMWPPVFRDDRRELNTHGIEQLGAILERGTVVGMHPEGRRGTEPNPYEQLPARAGLGHLVARCDAETLVVPYFILGLSNSFKQVTTRGHRRPEKRGEPIRIRFCPAISCGELRAGRTSQEMTDYVMKQVAAEGLLDRDERA
jgi:1-acyl-sn-glycerol-3-phosphate acyltransferase